MIKIRDKEGESYESRITNTRPIFGVSDSEKGKSESRIPNEV